MRGPQFGSSSTAATEAATAAFSSQRSSRSGSFWDRMRSRAESGTARPRVCRTVSTACAASSVRPSARPCATYLFAKSALAFVALHHRLQCAASRLTQGIVHEVVVEPDPVVVEPTDRGQHRGGDRRSLLGLAVRHRGKHAELGATRISAASEGRFLKRSTRISWAMEGMAGDLRMEEGRRGRGMVG